MIDCHSDNGHYVNTLFPDFYCWTG
jgi:hypothetical protein